MIPLSEQTSYVERHVAALGDWIGHADLAARVGELAAHPDLKISIEAAVAGVEFFRTKHWDSLLRLGLYRATEYALARSLGATAMVETGVLHGLSSAFLLQALIDNDGGGRLISIDYPSTFEDGPANQDGFDDTLPPGMMPGWVVDERRRAPWDLRLGQSRDLLPRALGDLGPLDIFVHDSEHTYETMTYEFETAWPALREGGLLVADNINVNTSFFDFARAVGRIPFVMPPDPEDAAAGAGIRFGILQK